jgi:hypothetical protein
MQEEELGFDLAAASIRADADQVAKALEVFATKLEGALPRACRVNRARRWLVAGKSRVVAVYVELGESRFTLRSHARGLACERTIHVHDMAERTERLQLDDWLAALEAELRAQAATHADARVALERLLLGDG